MRGAAASLLRRRDERAQVTQIELFFDLIFVFAVTQISEFLRAHMNALGALQAFMLFAAMWWIYFNDAAERTAHAFANAQNVGKIARAAYTYVHGLLIAAIIVIAAGDAFLLETPLQHASSGQNLLLLGGPTAFLLGNGIFRRMLHPRFPLSHLYGLALLVVLAVASLWCSLLVLSFGVFITLLAVIFISNALASHL